jgi:hypothetical protein
MSAGQAFAIAAQARRYALLSERPELLYPDPAVRAQRLVESNRASLDVVLLATVTDADRLCAAAVGMLNRDAPQAKPILDLLGVLPAECLLGVYFALPEDRRRQCESDAVWAYHLRRVPDGVGEAAQALLDLTLDDPLTPADQILEAHEAAEFRRFSEGLLRRAIDAPHDLSDREVALADAGERALSDVLANGD